MQRRPPVPGAPGRAALAGCAVAVLTTLALLRPALGRGQLLYRDFVQVPHPALGPAVLGADGRAPRAVPLDAVSAVLAPVVPTGVQQQVMLLASLAGAGCGLAVLLRHRGVLASCVAAFVATWSPYAVERLLVGQPPTLLGWAAVPWLVVALRSHMSPRRRAVAVLGAALPAALTPWGGLVAAAVVVVVGRRLAVRERLLHVGLALLWCAPWVVAGLLGASGAGEREGAAAFAVEADGARGLVDVVTGGGIWSVGATLGSRSGGLVLSASLVLLVAAMLALARVDLPERGLLVCALVVPPVLALLLATWGAGPWSAAQDLAGVGILRDTHRLLGLSTLALAVGCGLAAEAVVRSLPAPRPVVAVAAALSAAGLGVLTAPDAAVRLHDAYRPVQVPRGVDDAVAAIGGRTTLVLPWQPLRRQQWAGEQPFLDPLPLALPGRVLVSRELTVVRDGEPLVVASDPAGQRAAQAWGEGDLTTLRSQGVEAVVLWEDTPGAASVPETGIGHEVPLDGPLRVWLLSDPR